MNVGERRVFRAETAWAIFGVAGLGLCWLAVVVVGWGYSPDLGHGWAVPLLMAYLWWERWEERPALVERGRLGAGWWSGAGALALGALGLRLMLTPYPLWPTLLILYTMVLATVALLAAWQIAGGPGVRWIAGPLVLLLSCVPTPSVVETSIILPLRESMAALTAEICNLLGRPALAGGTSVRLAVGWIGIDEACSGIRSLQACMMMGLFFGEWYRCNWRRRVALVALGLFAALLGNFGRVLFLALRSAADPAAAARAHDLAGWLAMLLSLLLTGGLSWAWAGYRWPERRIRQRNAATNSPGWRWLAVVVALLIVNDLAVRLWFARGAADRRTIPQWTVRWPETQRSFRSVPLSESAREMLHPDRFSAGSWSMGEDMRTEAYYVEWSHGQIARSVPFLHNPTVCLPYAGCELTATLPPIDVAWTQGEVRFFAYTFRRTGEDMLVAFTIWDPARGRLLQRPPQSDSWGQWWVHQWDDIREARADQPAQLLAVSIPWQPDAVVKMRALLQGMVIAAPIR